MTPSTLLSCSSCSWTICRSTSCGLAPGHRVSTVIVGTWTSGVSCVGIVTSAMPPKSITSRTPTVTFTLFATQAAIRSDPCLGLRSLRSGSWRCRSPRPAIARVPIRCRTGECSGRAEASGFRSILPSRAGFHPAASRRASGLASGGSLPSRAYAPHTVLAVPLFAARTRAYRPEAGLGLEVDGADHPDLLAGPEPLVPLHDDASGRARAGRRPRSRTPCGHAQLTAPAGRSPAAESSPAEAVDDPDRPARGRRAPGRPCGPSGPFARGRRAR